jgi:hypothetical protein
MNWEVQDQGANLLLELRVPLIDALLGFNRSIRLLNGSIYHLQQDRVIMSGMELSVPGAGLPNPAPLLGGLKMSTDRPSSYGMLTLRFSIVFPTRLSKKQKKKLVEVLGELEASRIESIVRLSAAAEADFAGMVMPAGETFHTGGCDPLDPFFCPLDPVWEVQWLWNHPRCLRGPDGRDFWGPYCAMQPPAAIPTETEEEEH